MVEQRIKYTESYPDKLDLTFNTYEEYHAFYVKRFEEVSKKLQLLTPNSKHHYSDWKHNKIKLNKDGTPRKYFNPTHLRTEKAIKKQKIKFKEYLTGQIKLNQERALMKQVKENHINNITYISPEGTPYTKEDLDELFKMIKYHKEFNQYLNDYFG